MYEVDRIEKNKENNPDDGIQYIYYKREALIHNRQLVKNIKKRSSNTFMQSVNAV